MAQFASAVTSPKVSLGMATTTTTNPAEEMPEIRFQRKDERNANEGICYYTPLLGCVRSYV